MSRGKAIDVRQAIFHDQTKSFEELGRITPAHQIELLVAVIVDELGFAVGATWTPPQKALFAGMVISNFKKLRIEELIFILNKGANSGYGKIYGQLTYPMIAEWINAYYETDFETACAQNNADKIKASETKDSESLVPIKEISELAKKLSVQGRQELNESKTAYTPEYYDKQNYKLVYSLRQGFTDKELNQFKEDAETGNWPDTLKLINDEIEVRTAAQNTGAKEGN